MSSRAPKAINRRTFLATSAAVTAAAGLARPLAAQSTGKKTFTILHTNDIHSNLIGVAPALDFTPFSLNDDATLGGFARLATKVAERRAVGEALGPVLMLDAGDYSMGTAFGAAIRETGGELQLLSMIGCDATTFGNHDFDLGPDGTAAAIAVAAAAGHVPAVLATNTDFSADEPILAGLQQLAADGVIRTYLVIERGGLRFGIFGVLGKEAQFYTGGAVPATFSDPVEAARATVATLRDVEKVDVVIALSHSGMEKNADGTFTDGDDVRLAVEVPGIDVVVGAHSHTTLPAPVLANGRSPVVQAGKYGELLGELVVSIDGETLTVDSYQLHPIDDTIQGDAAIAEVIEGYKKTVTEVVFASRGFAIDQPLARVEQDIANTFSDIPASTILANLCTDAFRKSTGADISLTANGMMRSGFTKGNSGVQTVYDVFAVAPLGAGVLDATAGSTLVTGYFTGQEIKNILEFLLVDNPAHPGEYFPRASGLSFTYDPKRPQFDVVTQVELGDLDRGYTAVDITGQDQKLISLTCPMYFALILVAIPKYSKGALPLVPKNADGQPLASKVDAVLDLRRDTPDLLPPAGTIDAASISQAQGAANPVEIKEWQAIMEYLQAIPVAAEGELPIIRADERANEVRFIRVE